MRGAKTARRDDQFQSGPMQILDVPADWTWPPVGTNDFACTQDPIRGHANFRWPNAYFTENGLFSLKSAVKFVRQS